MLQTNVKRVADDSAGDSSKPLTSSQAGIDTEFSYVFQELKKTDSLLAEALSIENDSFARGNEAIVGKLSKDACQSKVVQEKIINWLIDHPEHIKALTKDWPNQNERELLLEAQGDELRVGLQRFLPESMMVKFVKPDSGGWDSEWGLRAVDANCLFQVELENGYFYFQEKLRMCFERPFLSDGYEYIDGALNQQCGYNRFGYLRLADYGAVGVIGTADDVLNAPETAKNFDDATIYDDRDGENVGINQSFALNLEGQFDDKIKHVIAEDLLNLWNGDSVTEEDREHVVAIVRFMNGLLENDARELVETVYGQLQKLQEPLLTS